MATPSRDVTSILTLQETCLPYMVRSKLKLLLRGEGDQALLTFVDEALTSELRKALLELRYSQELSLLYLLQDDIDRAKYYIQNCIQMFMQVTWACPPGGALFLWAWVDMGSSLATSLWFPAHQPTAWGLLAPVSDLESSFCFPLSFSFSPWTSTWEQILHPGIWVGGGRAGGSCDPAGQCLSCLWGWPLCC